MMGFVFSSSAMPGPPDAGDGTVYFREGGYGEAGLRADTLALRADLTRLRQVERTVGYEGRESRLVGAYLGLLAPGDCREVRAVEIRSARTSEGFTARASCQGKKSEATLEVSWTPFLAVARVGGRPGEVSLDLTGGTGP
jgi:hypothetical protein